MRELFEILLMVDAVCLIGIVLMCRNAPTLDEELGTYRSRQAMPDGSRDVEANNDAAENVHARSATRIDPTGRGGSNP